MLPALFHNPPKKKVAPGSNSCITSVEYITHQGIGIYNLGHVNYLKFK